MGRCSCGIDWAENHHDVALVDAEGRLVAKRRIAESVAGFAELTAMLAEAGDRPAGPDPGRDRDSARPAGRGAAGQRSTDLPDQPDVGGPLPGAAPRCRARSPTTVDAITLANILRTDADQHRRLPADTELAQSITVLARAHQDATWRRTRAGNELRSLLREYHPGFLHTFADRPGGISAPDARAVLAIAPPRPGRRGCPDRRSSPRCAAPDANAG